MKTYLIACMASVALPLAVWSQPPPAPPPPVTSPGASVPAATATVAPSAAAESELEQSIRKKHKRHFNFTIGDKDIDEKIKDKVEGSGNNDVPEFVLPIVGIVFLSIFGAPVLIVAVILYFGFSKSRMQHRTIRMMVEKGQPVPAELLAPPPPAVRQRSDMRRGVILLMIGVALMVFLGAINDWEGGSWAIGIIPFLVGAGYLLVWKLEGGKAKADNPPPLP
jgi:hypothetical protein